MSDYIKDSISLAKRALADFFYIGGAVQSREYQDFVNNTEKLKAAIDEMNARKDEKQQASAA